MKTRTFRLNKLVRDGVFDSMIKLGQKPQTKRLKGQALLLGLRNKIIEEAQEFDPKSKKAVRELADLAEMVEQLAAKMGISYKELRAMQMKRRKEAGVFNRGVFIGELEVPKGDKWADYYAADPKHFPEIKQ
ncbi:MAG TPA: nucleoside triphosphate pyrophosphohydrolase [Candidatus Saccharimonadales bacterium]|nr:nucleoside triphosphate pyrophosphohydrolase [Candidatus Saccharimonadales bacterium]